MLVLYLYEDGKVVAEHHITHCIDLREKKCEKCENEKTLLILTEIMLIKVRAKKGVANGSQVNASW